GVHLRDGTSHIEALQEALNASGWLASIDAGQDTDLAALQRTLDLERRALVVGATVATIAGVVLGGLLVLTQLRRELRSDLQLRALGMRRRDLRVAALLRVMAVLV